MRKVKPLHVIVAICSLSIIPLAFGGSRIIAIDDLNGAGSYASNGYRWDKPQHNTAGQLGFSMKIGTTVINGGTVTLDPLDPARTTTISNSSRFVLFEDGFVALIPTGPFAAFPGSNYTPGATLSDIKNPDGSPAFVIAPFFTQLDAPLTSGVFAGYVDGEAATNTGDVAPGAPAPGTYPLPAVNNNKWGKATWYGLTSPLAANPDRYTGQVEFRDFGDTDDGDFDFFIRTEGFGGPSYPVDGVGGVSFGGIKYLFSAADVLAGTNLTDFTVRDGVVTGFGLDNAGNAFSRVFTGATDPGGNGVPSPGVALLLAAGGLGLWRRKG